MTSSALVTLNTDGSFMVSLDGAEPQRMGCSHNTGFYLRDLLKIAAEETPDDELPNHRVVAVNVLGVAPKRPTDTGDHPITKLPPKGRKLKGPELTLEDLGLTGDELLKAMETLGITKEPV